MAGPGGDGIVEGFIDLLFEEEDGLVIVDYKTDTLGSDDEIERAMSRLPAARGRVRAGIEQGDRSDGEGGVVPLPGTES